MFQKLISSIAHDSGSDDINIVSLMSYNVDLSNTQKVFLQQLQWPILRKELKRLDKKINQLEGLINVNIMLPDRNFIGYNNIFNPNALSKKDVEKLLEEVGSSSQINDSNFESIIKLINETSNNENPQIDKICNIKINTAFNKNAHEYNYRISKYSTMLQNFKLGKIFQVSESLEKIVQLNFYYVGIIFDNIEYDDPKKFLAYGFDFSPLSLNNLHVHVWTGDKII